MRSSCICHPANRPLLIIREWQLAFCDGNHCAAALLSFFEYWHNIKLAASERARQANERAREQGKPATYDESLLQFHTDEDLRIGLLDLYGTMKIRASRRLLIEKKALSEHPNPSPRYAFDKTIYYLFHDDVVNAWLERCNDGTPIAKNGDSFAKNGDGEGEKQFIINELQAMSAQITTETTTKTTTTTGAPAQTEPPWPDGSDQGSSSSSNTLIFDYHLANLSETQRQRAIKMLEELDRETAQQVLDEWNQAISNHSIKKSRWAWLNNVIGKAKAGTFVPTSDLADRRQPPVQPVAATTQRPRVSSAVWQAHCEELQEALRGKTVAPHIPALRGVEEGGTLWLEAPNQFVADDVQVQMPVIERVLRPHTALAIQVCVG